MARASVTGKVLADFPLVAAQLDRKAHPCLDISAYRAGERNEKLHWTCPEGPDHTWTATAKARCGAGTGCPFCAGHQPSVTNSLATLFPEVARELRSDREPYLGADSITAKSGTVVFWECPRGHVYDLGVAHRTDLGQNCPVCAGKRVIASTSLGGRYPHLAAEWHPTKNHKSAFQIAPNDNRKYWWLCPQGHAYDTKPLHRVQAGSGCPVCSHHKASWEFSLAKLSPQIAAELDPDASGFTAQEVTFRSNRMASWICSANPSHRWECSIVGRTHPRTSYGCPFCSGRRPSPGNNLLDLYPDIAAELDYALNDGIDPANLLSKASAVYTWRCRRNAAHTWRQTVVARTSQGVGCPRCDAGRRFSRLEVRLAQLLAEVIPVSLDTRFVETPEGRAEVDIPIPDWKLDIEYDGAFWHVGKEERDRRKNSKLASDGWAVLRLRQAPLKKLTPHDLLLSRDEPDPVDLAHLVLGHLSAVMGRTVPTRLTQEQQRHALEAAELRIETKYAEAERRRAARAARAARAD